MKYLILDAGPLINLSMNGLLYIFEELKKVSNFQIIISDNVYKEVVERPSKIPRFELGALRIKDLVDRGVIIKPEKLGLSKEQIESKAEEIVESINSSVKTSNKKISLVSLGETSCLAISNILSERNEESIIGIDERTTRILFEKPINLEKIMSHKLHQKIKINLQNINKIGEFRFIRSSEIVFVAYKKGLIKNKSPRVLEALLFATKYKGTSISFEEISEMKRM